MKKVTIKEIANVCGVSVATVSLVLNGKTSEIGPETVKRVLETAKEMNYSKNQIARSLVTKKSETIAILVPDIRNMFYSTIIKAVSKSASSRGYSIMLCDTDNDADEELRQLRLLDNRLIDGILLASRNSQKLLENYENQRKLPIVIIDEETDTQEKNIYTVASDNEEAAYKMTNYLIQKGHRRFFCLTGVTGSTNSARRQQGVMRALTENNISFDKATFVHADYKMDRAYQLIMKSEKPEYTALICFNDLMAYGAIKALNEKGIRVPEDVSVVGFDTNTSQNLVSEISAYKLTSINQDENRIGEISTELLLGAIEGKANKQKIHLLPSDWLEGTTTSGPKQ